MKEFHSARIGPGFNKQCAKSKGGQGCVTPSFFSCIGNQEDVCRKQERNHQEPE
jgi:hypothetical protein